MRQCEGLTCCHACSDVAQKPNGVCSTLQLGSRQTGIVSMQSICRCAENLCPPGYIPVPTSYFPLQQLQEAV